jgi:conjugative transfer signal peptidase TraF
MCADPTGRGTRIGVIAILVMAAAAIVISSQNERPWLLYNASGSAPIGFYRIEYRSPHRGETAVIRPSATLEKLLSTHGLLPSGVPLLKQIIALGGDRICRSDGVILINGKAIAEALDHDAEGRPLPAWDGCFTLFAGQFFLLQPHPYSFDSRYFGPVGEAQIIGVARPLWTWNPAE